MLDLLPLPSQERSGFFGRKPLVAALCLATLAIFLLPFGVSASIGDTIALSVTALFNFMTMAVGQLLLVLIAGLIYIAQYDGFVTSTAVANGWVIVRDIANMFFIVALLLIAFGTMLGLSNYHYSKTLPRLVIMAILVNFSRTICGLIIDFAQIVMLTFVHGFKEAAGGNFVHAFQINSMMQAGSSAPQETGSGSELWDTTIAMILAFVLVTIASGVVVIMIVVLITRIIFLWLLVVLSPLAFLASAIPIGQASSFYSRWWGKFNKQVVVGPFLAFFLWLALVSVSTDNFHTQGFPGGETGAATTESLNTQAAGAISSEQITKFIIGIALLLGGVAMAQEMSSAVSAGKGVLKGAGKVGVGAAKLGARGVAAGAKFGYKVTGGERAVDRAKERAYTGLGKVPLAGGYFRKKAALQRQNIATKGAADTQLMAQMSPDELKREARRPTLSAEGRGRRKGAIQEMVRRAGDRTNDFEFDSKEEYHKYKKEALKQDKLTHDTSGAKAFREFEKKNMDYIMDPDATGAERQQQVGKYVEASRRLNTGTLSEMNANSYTPGMVMNASATAIVSSIDKMSAEQSEAMFAALGMGADEQKELSNAKPGAEKSAVIKAAQQRLKNDKDNFEFMSNQEKARLIQQHGAGGIGAKKLSTLDLASLNSDTRKDVTGNMSRIVADDDIKRLPQEMAAAIRGEMKDAGRIMATGGSVSEAFKGYDSQSGNFADKEGRKRFKDFMMQGDDMGQQLGQIPPEVFQRGGGINDASVLAVGNVQAGDLMNMAKRGNYKQASAIRDSANKMEAVNVEEAVKQHEMSLPVNMSAEEVQASKATFEVNLKLAKENATKIIDELSKSDSVLSKLGREDEIEKKMAAAEKKIEERISKMEQEAQARLDKSGEALERKLIRKAQKRNRPK